MIISPNIFVKAIQMARRYKKTTVTKEELTNYYVEQQMSMVMISKILDCSNGHVNWLFNKFNIRKRNKSEALKLAINLGRAERPSIEDHPNYKNGRILMSGGYIGILMKDHPEANLRHYVFEHRLVWERIHGPIPEGWVIHHLNGIKTDNRPENLSAMPRKSHHYALLLNALRKRIRALEGELNRIKIQEKLL
jgi:hypothetical protein